MKYNKKHCNNPKNSSAITNPDFLFLSTKYVPIKPNTIEILSNSICAPSDTMPNEFFKYPKTISKIQKTRFNLIIITL